MESNMNFLDTLTEPQQLQVYELMAITNIEDGNVAAKLYIEANYDTSRAIQNFFDRQAGVPEPAVTNVTPLANNPRVNNPPQRQRNPENEMVSQYKRHIQRKRLEEEEKGVGDSVKTGVNTLVTGFRSMWNMVVPTAIRGETPGGEQFLAYFHKNYPKLNKQVKWNWGTFEENVQQAQNSKRPLLVYLHLDSSVFKNIPNNLFSKKPLTDFMNNKFLVLGLLVNTEGSEVLLKYVETKNCPCLAAFRVNLLEETVMVEAITLTNDSTPEQVLEQLQNLEKNYYRILKDESKIKQNAERSLADQHRRLEQMHGSPFMFGVDNNQQYNNQGFQFINAVQPPARREISPEEQARIEEARVLRHIQQEEFKEVERQIMEAQQKSEQEEKLRKEKLELEEIMRKSQEEEERRKKEEKEKLKQQKLERLTAEPAEGDKDVIRIIFRVPNGERVERRFLMSDKAETLYDYIDSKDLEFDPTTVRYDLMQPRPFLVLEDKEKSIGEYFEGSDSEVIVVREHTN